MSRLDELIKELCPDGVEYKKISEVTTVARGKRVVKKELSLSEGYPVYQNSLTIMGYYTDMNYPAGTTFIIGAGAAGEIGYSTEAFWAADDCFPVPGNDTILDRYIFHSLLCRKEYLASRVRKASIPRLSRNVIEELVIPVPPLPVQEEIVKILDKFTDYVTELQAELQARRLQYEYYRDKLLPFEEDVADWKSLGDICSIARGASPRPIKNYITEDIDAVNWIKIGDATPGAKYIYSCKERITTEGAKKSRRVYPGNFILSNSMSFGRPYILKIEGCIHDGWLSISEYEESVTSDYLYHVLTSNYVQRVMEQKASFGGAVQNLNADIVRSIEIPIVSIQKQEEIVSMLDKFSMFCTDITSGLPAEIEARQRQYEYYRDKLLTFKELS